MSLNLLRVTCRPFVGRSQVLFESALELLAELMDSGADHSAAAEGLLKSGLGVDDQ